MHLRSPQPVNGILWLLPFWAISLSGFAQTGWQWLNPKPQGNHLKKVQWLNAQVAYACGEAGTLLKSGEGGSTWTMLRTRTNLNLNGLSMVKPDSGFAVGDSGLVLKTFNAGTAWFKQAVPSNRPFFGVHFVSTRLGWVCGQAGNLWRTQNGGTSWQAQTAVPETDLFDIRFANPQVGWTAGSGGRIFKTTNGGTSWQGQASGTTKNIRFLFARDVDSVFAVGDSGLVLKTTNGGSAWTILPTNADNLDFQSFFSTGDTLLATGGSLNQDPAIVLSVDGGQNWVLTTYQPTRPIFAVSFRDARHGLAVGADGEIHRTQDRFETGTALKTGIAGDFQTGHFFSADSGFVFGRDNALPQLLETSNGGQTWTNAASAGIFIPQDVQFVSSQVGYVAGTGGAISKTTDRGGSWTPLTTNVTQTIWGLHFLQDLGYAAGSEGTLLKTTNAGQNWAVQTSATGATARIFDVFAADAQVAYAVGEGGIQKTSDGGQNWLSQWTGDTLLSLYFFSPTSGFAVGNRGKILRTSNGGQAWQVLDLGLSQNLSKIYFRTPANGVMVGQSGLVLLTLNGGQDWFRQLSYNRSSLQSAFLVNDTVGYIWGSNGAILKTTTGGSTCPDATFSYQGIFLPGRFCQSDTIRQTLYFDGTPGGTFSSNPPGLNLQANTGLIDPSLSQPGVYNVIYSVTPPNGCPTQTFQTTATIQAPVFIPRSRLEVRRPPYSLPPLTAFVPCGGDTLVARAQNRFQDLKFTWYRNQALLPDTNQELRVTQSGLYAVKYRNQACVGPHYDTVDIQFEDQARPRKPGLSLDQALLTCNGTFSLSSSGSGSVAYQWIGEPGNNPLPGQTSATLSLGRGGRYRLQIDSLGCKNLSEPIDILAIGADTVLPQLSRVYTKGQDIGTERNVLVWNRNTYDTTEIKRIWVYRSDEAYGLYNPIADLPASDSTYTDPQALPADREYAYRISARQLCGNDLFFSPASENQNSLHLQLAVHPPATYILRWNVPAGFPVQTFRVWRGSDYANLAVVANNIPASVNSWKDPNPGAGPFFYRVEAETQQQIVPWGRISAGIRKSFSNTRPTVLAICDSCAGAVDVSRAFANQPVWVYPNPSRDRIRLSGGPEGAFYDYRLFDLRGRLMQLGRVQPGEHPEQVLPPGKGMYLLHLSGPDTQRFRIVKE